MPVERAMGPGARGGRARWLGARVVLVVFAAAALFLADVAPARATTHVPATTYAVSTTWAYDADGRETGKGSTSYGYDGQGNRLSASDGTTTTDYEWDENAPLPQLALEQTGSGSLLRRYVQGPAGPLTEQTSSGSYDYLHTQDGSAEALIDNGGSFEWQYAYEPFGTQRSATKVDPSAPDNPVGFQGQYQDSANGMYDLRARAYDPGDGRFTSNDPLAPALSDPYVSAYAYANNQPTLLTDPSGMDAVEFFSKLRHLGEQLTNPAIEAASLVPGAAGLALHGGEWVVTSTVDGLVAQARDSWDCASTIITTGEMRGVGRQCLKAVALGALTLAGLPELDAGVLTLSSLGRAESGNVLRRLAYDETGTLWIGRDAAEEGTTLYRAVGPSELSDIENVGRYRAAAGQVEGKHFFATPEETSNFARMMGDKPYTTTSVRVSASDLAKTERVPLAREGEAYFFRTPDIPSGPVTIFGHSVVP
jgi:RHS repeat-associated protein